MYSSQVTSHGGGGGKDSLRGGCKYTLKLTTIIVENFVQNRISKFYTRNFQKFTLWTTYFEWEANTQSYKGRSNSNFRSFFSWALATLWLQHMGYIFEDSWSFYASYELQLFDFYELKTLNKTKLPRSSVPRSNEMRSVLPIFWAK